ncbi:MAG: hypothetical protein FD141_168 [Fusobacteria bacterium]|nr:MAG: hypothetical protein FD141_168 [Fusobacteriota bacterium]KAF0229168.1 MAG: hypothetical protein FD182_1424 [Fusobacteriota bacterium]
MKEFKEYLNKIKAEEGLKVKTIKYIRMESNKINQKNNKRNNEKYFGKGVFGMKKLAGALFSVAVLAIVALGGFNLYNSPVAYVSMDINPSVELGLNFMNRVVSVEGVNDDGRGLLTEMKLENMTAEEAVQAFVQEANKKGYLNEDGSSVVALTTFAKNEKKAEKIEDRIQDRVKKIIAEKSMDYVVYSDHANLELRSEAEKYDISPGKYRLILMLQELDSSIEVTDYKDATVKEIMFKIHDLKGIGQNRNDKSKDFERNRAIINETAQQAIIRAQNKKNNPK